jgi:hypothetical protein
MKGAQLAKQEEYIKLNQQNHNGPPYQQNRNSGRNENDQPICMIVTKIKKNDHALIAADHHHKIAPTPRHAALATTADTEHRSMMTRKDNEHK